MNKFLRIIKRAITPNRRKIVDDCHSRHEVVICVIGMIVGGASIIYGIYFMGSTV